LESERKASPDSGGEASTQCVLRGLAATWLDFETRLYHIPIVKRVFERRIRLAEYHQLLLNHRAQVLSGGSWITRAASHIGHEFADLRSRFIRHAATEHRDYLMLEQDYLHSGGAAADLRQREPNIGSEALSAWMFHRADQPNPFDLLGAMYIIEGLGKRVAGQWAEHVQAALGLPDQAVSFYRYHATADADHLGELEEALRADVLALPEMASRILKTARVTARLYRLQLEEIGSY
jgi:3-oxoacyl-[acyl-carrier-protein] synthase-3